MEEDILNYSPTFMFRGTPGINSDFKNFLKGVFAKNERGYRLNAIKKRF